MKKTIRTFAIGLFTAGIIMVIGIFFFDSNSNTLDELSAEEMIPLIKEDGYHVLTSDEYISLSVKSENINTDSEEKAENEATDKKEVTKTKEPVKEETEKTQAANQSKKEKAETKEETSTPEKKQEEKIINYTLNIEPGMPASTITSVLADQGIIDDASEFNNYLDEHDYTLKVRMGTHKVTSAMSFYELAEAITK
ncbi:hypothetical protein [Oceanobacillus chungangensis]|uniref:hypothetical protein n=1 Tax=Oceanobacillus chungangensis TaxID=1229152 RepID=UPI001FE36621|nr:hypothetical protein [Oceanobacillus chungangensis]